MKPAALRVLFLTEYYAPEVGAPQTRLRETARHLVALGHEIRVLTAPPHYPDGRVRPGYHALAVQRERIDDVEVVRLPMIPRPNGGFLDRVIDQGSFAAAAMTGVGQARWADAVVIESPPLFLGATGAFLRRASGTPYIFHVADPWPDIPIAVGALTNPVTIRVARWLERLAYRHAALVTTVTPGLVDQLGRLDLPAVKVRLLPNGADVGRFDPAADPVAARRRLGWPADPFTLVYAGTVGLAQGLETLVAAAKQLQSAAIEIRVIGAGADRDALQARAAASGLGHLHFDPPVDASAVPSILAAADATLTMLKAGPAYAHALPTKLVEGLAAGRPVIVSADGASARIVSDGAAGLVVPPEDGVALAAAIAELTRMRVEARRAMGMRARTLAETTFDRRAIAERLVTYIREAIAPPPPGIHATVASHGWRRATRRTVGEPRDPGDLPA